MSSCYYVLVILAMYRFTAMRSLVSLISLSRAPLWRWKMRSGRHSRNGIILSVGCRIFLLSFRLTTLSIILMMPHFFILAMRELQMTWMEEYSWILGHLQWPGMGSQSSCHLMHHRLFSKQQTMPPPPSSPLFFSSSKITYQFRFSLFKLAVSKFVSLPQEPNLFLVRLEFHSCGSKVSLIRGKHGFLQYKVFMLRLKQLALLTNRLPKLCRRKLCDPCDPYDPFAIPPGYLSASLGFIMYRFEVYVLDSNELVFKKIFGYNDLRSQSFANSSGYMSTTLVFFVLILGLFLKFWWIRDQGDFWK